MTPRTRLVDDPAGAGPAGSGTAQAPPEEIDPPPDDDAVDPVSPG